ncbi:GNAT family N-acetyltransferase [Streptomyces noursei]|nr:GNAT family N-acetyltransferase [Streptomyces noursei]
MAADFNRPGLVPESDTLLVHDGVGRLAARARVNRRSEVDVHPVHRGRGLGAALLDWAEARARRAGSEGIVQTVPGDDAHAVALLRSTCTLWTHSDTGALTLYLRVGMTVRRSSTVFRTPRPARPT